MTTTEANENLILAFIAEREKIKPLERKQRPPHRALIDNFCSRDGKVNAKENTAMLKDFCDTCWGLGPRAKNKAVIRNFLFAREYRN